jgi:hypothetical protein
MTTNKLKVSSILTNSLFGSALGGEYVFTYGPLEPRIKLHKFSEFLDKKANEKRVSFFEKNRFLSSRSKRIRAGPLTTPIKN